MENKGLLSRGKGDDLPPLFRAVAKPARLLATLDVTVAPADERPQDLEQEECEACEEREAEEEADGEDETFGKIVRDEFPIDHFSSPYWPKDGRVSRWPVAADFSQFSVYAPLSQ